MPDLHALLSHVTIGAALDFRGVTVFPLLGPCPQRQPTYSLLSHALRGGALEISETNMQGYVKAINRAGSPVLVIEGDHLVGAYQNRAVASSALLPGAHVTKLPVACVEQGRSTGDAVTFAGAAPLAPANVRRILKDSVTRSVMNADVGQHAADQQAIWRQIARQQSRLRVSSATRSLAATYATSADALAEYRAALPCPATARGVALALGDELMSLDLFDCHRTCREYWDQLVAGAALDALDSSPPRQPGQRAAQQLRIALERLTIASWQPVTPVGTGQELRVALGDLSASMLLAQGHLLHLGAAVPVVRSGLRPVRQALPPALTQRYRIEGRIGVGGAKEVFLATELATARHVAVARIPGADPMELHCEVELARRIGAEHTIAVYEALLDDQDDGYLVMEYCPGPNLAQLAGGGLPVDEAGPIMLAFARALAAIHRAEVLHRDVKLENVLIAQTPDGPRLKIIDFGVSARARNMSTSAGVLPFSGTLPYMSTEALIGRPLDARADVFSFGVCCHRLLTGEVPTPPLDDEGEHTYLMRLRMLERHDLSRLPPLPAAVTALLARMLDVRAERRPYLPEVLPVLEAEFGHLPLKLPVAGDRDTPAAGAATRASARPRGEAAALPLWSRIDVDVRALERVLVAPCHHAPLVVLEPAARATLVRAFGEDGAERWRTNVPGRLLAGARADLDSDGVRELYLAGPDQVAMLTARGELRYSRPRADAARWDDSSALRSLDVPPSVLALTDPVCPRLVVDGRVLEPQTGDDLGRLPMAYEGDGRQLADAKELAGISYNGNALQAFRGARGTAAAILHHPGRERFAVAQLEASGPRVQLAAYGPGGRRLCSLTVATCEIPTGDRSAILRMSARSQISAEHAPLAVLGPEGTAVVIAPFLATPPWLPASVVALHVPSGRELWRARLDCQRVGALLADLDGDGRAELLVGTGQHLLRYEPWTGAAGLPIECAGLPVAFGDLFGVGVACLVTVGPGGIELRRGPTCAPRAMQWAGPRGDLWRTGAVHLDGSALGPL